MVAIHDRFMSVYIGERIRQWVMVNMLRFPGSPWLLDMDGIIRYGGSSVQLT